LAVARITQPPETPATGKTVGSKFLVEKNVKQNWSNKIRHSNGQSK